MKIFIILLFIPASLFGGWEGESFLGITGNPTGLVNETLLSYRISFADTNTFLLSEAHLDLGTFISVFPVGGLFAGRIQFSPLLFLDIGFMAGIHTCWNFYVFPERTTIYNESIRKTISSNNRTLTYISPFWIIKLKFGSLILYNSFYLEKFFNNKLWYYWYPELMIRNGWIFYWNSYSIIKISSSFSLMISGHLQKSYDTKDIRFHLGPGIRINIFNNKTYLVSSIEYHFKKVNFSGIKLATGVETSFSW